MSKIIKDKKILKSVGKKYGLEFDKDHGYYTGDAYENNRGESLSTFEDNMTVEGMIVERRTYRLQYFDGCFNPFLVEINDGGNKIQ